MIARSWLSLRLAGRPSAKIRAARVDQKTPSDRLATDQHPKTHRVTVGQRQFDRNRSADDVQRRQDHKPLRRDTIAAADMTPIKHRRFTPLDQPIVTLNRVHVKSHPLFPAPDKGLDIERVQATRPSPRIDFGLDRSDRQVRQTDPFPPTDDRQRITFQNRYSANHDSPSIRPARQSTRHPPSR